VRGARYHGSFEHPVRAFVIGVTLLVLLFGGFVVGVEAGTHPLEQAVVTRLTVTDPQVSTRTVAALTTRVDGHTRIIHVASKRTRVVIIRLHGKKFIYVATPGSTATSGPQSAAAPTLLTVPTDTVTVTEPPDTVAEPPVTVTVTVTEPGTTDTSGTSNASTSSTGP
jgi:hypothetical protein